MPTHYSPVINNSQHRQPSVQPPLIHLLPPVSPAFVRRSRRPDAYPRFPPGLAMTAEEDPRPPSTGSQKIGAASQSQTLIGRHTFLSLKGAPHCMGSIYASETVLFISTDSSKPSSHDASSMEPSLITSGLQISLSPYSMHSPFINLVRNYRSPLSTRPAVDMRQKLMNNTHSCPQAPKETTAPRERWTGNIPDDHRPQWH